MKTLITFLITLTLLIGNFAKPYIAQQTTAVTSTSVGAGTYKLTIVLANVNKRSGTLNIGLATDEATFTGESVQKKSLDVPASGEVSITFEGLTPGRYAVRIYQDLNANNKMDFSGQMPAEPFGFSNVTMLMGPPTFDQCSFDLAENKTIQVGLMSL